MQSRRTLNNNLAFNIGARLFTHKRRIDFLARVRFRTQESDSQSVSACRQAAAGIGYI